MSFLKKWRQKREEKKLEEWLNEKTPGTFEGSPRPLGCSYPGATSQNSKSSPSETTDSDDGTTDKVGSGNTDAGNVSNFSEKSLPFLEREKRREFFKNIRNNFDVPPPYDEIILDLSHEHPRDRETFEKEAYKVLMELAIQQFSWKVLFDNLFEQQLRQAIHSAVIWRDLEESVHLLRGETPEEINRLRMKTLNDRRIEKEEKEKELRKREKGHEREDWGIER